MAADAPTWLIQSKFWILLSFSIPSILCSIFIFIYFIQQKQNFVIDHHLTLTLTIVCFLQLTTNIPFIIDYYRLQIVFSSTNAFCLWWTWWEYSLNGLLLFLMAWGSIERHILIFHRTLINTKRKRIIFHFIPTIIAGCYPCLFYFVVVILNSCENNWDYDEVFCEIPCYLADQAGLATFDFVGNIVVPVFIIIIANISLIYRVVRQRRRHRIEWRRHAKLTKQLFLISLMYTCFWSPLTINGIITTFLPLPNLFYIQVNYFFFLLHLIPILSPFMSLVSLSNFRKIIFKNQLAVISPVTR